MGECMRILKALTPILLALALVGLGPNIGASSDHDSYIYLYDDGADLNASATTDWRFYLATPSYFGLDDTDEYWNFTCYGQMVNNTGEAYADNWAVTVYIEAGGVNQSVSSEITCSKTALVYGNVSFPELVYSLFDANSSAAVYVTLENVTAATVVDTWAGTIRIESNSMTGMVYALIGVIIPIAILVMVIGWFGEVNENIKKSMSPRSSGGSRKKR